MHGAVEVKVNSIEDGRIRGFETVSSCLPNSIRCHVVPVFDLNLLKRVPTDLDRAGLILRRAKSSVEVRGEQSRLSLIRERPG